MLVFFLALGLTFYPIISNAYNERHQSEIHTAYVEVVEEADNTELLTAREQAIAYNESIVPGSVDGNAYSQAALTAASENYDDLLNLGGSGIMGYVEIPAIDVYLPIYHGTDSDSLERGVGHLLGSSLPVGGASTHAILTGHSGMASQKMFTDITQLEMGDVFYLHVLDEILAYQVIQTNTVLPHDTSYLSVTPGEDYCTLVTCTPVGVNTHRLLVRGSRIPYEEAEVIVEEKFQKDELPVSTWERQYITGLQFGISAVIAIALLYFCFRSRKKRSSPKMSYAEKQVHRRKRGKYETD